jgi:hypothetical protein
VDDFFADRFHAPRNFVPERQGQAIDRGNAGAIVRVGVANSAGSYSDQNFGRPDLWEGDFGLLQRFADLHELDSPHEFSSRCRRNAIRTVDPEESLGQQSACRPAVSWFIISCQAFCRSAKTV